MVGQDRQDNSTADEGNAPWLQEVPEETDVLLQSGGRPIGTIFISLIFLGVFTGLIYWLYNKANDGALSDDAIQVAIVSPPDTPIKVEPEDRGGLRVPDRDKLIFDGISGKNDNQVENIQPAPEQPVARPVAQGEQITTNADEGTKEAESQPAPNTPTVEDMVAEINEGSRAESPASTATNQAPAADNNTQPVATSPTSSPPVAAKVVEEEVLPATEPTVALPAIPEGSFLIQLGAFGKKESAEAAWMNFQERFPVALRNLSTNISGVNIGRSNQLYRLQAGPFATRSSADRTCRTIKDQKQACIVIAPK